LIIVRQEGRTEAGGELGSEALPERGKVAERRDKLITRWKRRAWTLCPPSHKSPLGTRGRKGMYQ
jgi:hypothetical protein